jgi:hypothetical protein
MFNITVHYKNKSKKAKKQNKTKNTIHLINVLFVSSVIPILIVGITMGVTRLKGYHSDK